MSNKHLIAIEIDMLLALERYWREHLRYMAHSGVGGSQGVTTISGYVQDESGIDTVPYGDVYRKGDTFVTEGNSTSAGQLYYVVSATPGDPELTVQPDRTVQLLNPQVNVTTDHYRPEVVSKRVHVGLRSVPRYQGEFVRSLYATRQYNIDRDAVIFTEPFWYGRVHVTVEGLDKLDASSVYEQVNSRLRINTPLYRLQLDYRPDRSEIRNLEIAGRFQNVLSSDVALSLTEHTPLRDLPDGLPYAWYDDTPIEGAMAVIEALDNNPELANYAELIYKEPV